MKNITFEELKDIVWSLEGKSVFVKTGSLGFTFKILDKIENVNMYTDSFKIEFEKVVSSFELDSLTIDSIILEEELSRNNTNSIKIKLNNEQLISFEYEV